MDYFYKTILLFLAEDALQLARQSTGTNLSLIPLFLPEEGRERPETPDADDDNCSSTFHFHFRPRRWQYHRMFHSLVCLQYGLLSLVLLPQQVL